MDNKALKILFNYFWSASGWKMEGERAISPGDLAYAMKKGVMFAPFEVTHDEILNRVRALIGQINPVDVARQFIASLSTRRLELRSALGSYAVGKHLMAHPFSGKIHCNYCGEYYGSAKMMDLNVFNFERFKWGGVRHSHPSYIMFDLEQFLTADKLQPSSHDFAIMNEILSVVYAQVPDAKPRDLVKQLAPLFKSNESERRQLVEILGYCSVLQNPEYPSYLEGFIPIFDRAEPPEHKNDWSYPVCWWKGRNGVNNKALNIWFPFKEIGLMDHHVN